MEDAFNLKGIPPELVARKEGSLGAAHKIFFGNEEFIREAVNQWKEKDKTRVGEMSGALGIVYKITLGGRNYFIKYMGLKDEKYDNLKGLVFREIYSAAKLTGLAPHAVSKLVGAVYATDPRAKTLVAYLIYEGPSGYDLRKYVAKYFRRLEADRMFPTIYCAIKKAQKVVNDLGFVHRDIKPENIFIEVDPANDYTFVSAKLIDMGTVNRIGIRAGRAGTRQYWPLYMYHANTFEEVNKGLTAVKQNDYSVDVIWWRDFRQVGPVPDCQALAPVPPAPPASIYRPGEATELNMGLAGIPLPVSPINGLRIRIPIAKNEVVDGGSKRKTRVRRSQKNKSRRRK
jgi:serine/threonine protein kinase